MFDLSGKTAVVTGGYGVLGGSIADALGASGAKVAILGRSAEAAEAKVHALRAAGVEAMALQASVLDDDQLASARDVAIREWRKVDILINAAGGNLSAARTDGKPPFSMSREAFDDVIRLNLHGTVYPTMIFGEAMARESKGCVVVIS